MVLLKAPIGGAFQHFDHSGKALKSVDATHPFMSPYLIQSVHAPHSRQINAARASRMAR
jgi:hypothetical protein